jgi:hypothetical protein
VSCQVTAAVQHRILLFCWDIMLSNVPAKQDPDCTSCAAVRALGTGDVTWTEPEMVPVNITHILSWNSFPDLRFFVGWVSFEVTAVHITAAVRATCLQRWVKGARRLETTQLSENVTNRLPDVVTNQKCKEILSFKFAFFYVLTLFVALR